MPDIDDAWVADPDGSGLVLASALRAGSATTGAPTEPPPQPTGGSATEGQSTAQAASDPTPVVTEHEGGVAGAPAPSAGMDGTDSTASATAVTATQAAGLDGVTAPKSALNPDVHLQSWRAGETPLLVRVYLTALSKPKPQPMGATSVAAAEAVNEAAAEPVDSCTDLTTSPSERMVAVRFVKTFAREVSPQVETPLLVRVYLTALSKEKSQPMGTTDGRVVATRFVKTFTR